MSVTDIERFNRATEFTHTHYDESKRQQDMCLEYLKEYGSITPLEALSAFNSLRLSSLIFRLRNDGYNIETKINENGKPFAVYTLIEEGDE